MSLEDSIRPVGHAKGQLIPGQFISIVTFLHPLHSALLEKGAIAEEFRGTLGDEE